MEVAGRVSLLLLPAPSVSSVCFVVQTLPSENRAPAQNTASSRFTTENAAEDTERNREGQPQRPVFQRSAGWCSARSQALADIETAMATVGFLDREIADFAEFWDRELPAVPWLTVYPQRDPAPPDIGPRPDHLLQLWFLVERGCAPVDAPDLEPTPRQGTHAADWGVVLGPGLASPEHEGLALGLPH
jgi:hypothetical protein